MPSGSKYDKPLEQNTYSYDVHNHTLEFTEQYIEWRGWISVARICYCPPPLLSDDMKQFVLDNLAYYETYINMSYDDIIAKNYSIGTFLKRGVRYWCEYNCVGNFDFVDEFTIEFENEDDAMLFKLSWIF